MNRKLGILTSLGFSVLAGAAWSQTAESIDELDARHAAAMRSFETETRTELTRIARDKSLDGERKILRIEQWFITHADRIAEINRMAEALDQSKPLALPAPLARFVDTSPEGAAASTLHELSRSLAKGEITPAEFDRQREPLLVRISAIDSSVKPVRERLPAPPLPADLSHTSLPEKLANALHAQNRYLASLPENEAAEIRANPDSSINRLLDALDSQEQAGDTDEKRSEPSDQPIE